MKTIQLFINEYFKPITLVLLVFILLRSCGGGVSSLNKRVDKLSNKIDSLSQISVTSKSLKIEGLKVEKRMIQSTDRKLLDVQRQTKIDEEISSLEK